MVRKCRQQIPDLNLYPPVPFFRLLGAADLPDVMRIERCCFKRVDRFELKEYLDLLEKGGLAYVIGSPVRAVMWLVRVRRGLEIFSLATMPHWRRRGYAEMLIKHAIACMRWNRCSSLVLEVRVSNKGAIKLYRRHGFNIIRRKKNYYGNEDAYTMRKRAEK